MKQFFDGFAINKVCVSLKKHPTAELLNFVRQPARILHRRQTSAVVVRVDFDQLLDPNVPVMRPVQPVEVVPLVIVPDHIPGPGEAQPARIVSRRKSANDELQLEIDPSFQELLAGWKKVKPVVPIDLAIPKPDENTDDTPAAMAPNLLGPDPKPDENNDDFVAISEYSVQDLIEPESQEEESAVKNVVPTTSKASSKIEHVQEIGCSGIEPKQSTPPVADSNEKNPRMEKPLPKLIPIRNENKSNTASADAQNAMPNLALDPRGYLEYLTKRIEELDKGTTIQTNMEKK